MNSAGHSKKAQRLGMLLVDVRGTWDETTPRRSGPLLVPECHFQSSHQRNEHIPATGRVKNGPFAELRDRPGTGGGKHFSFKTASAWSLQIHVCP